MLDVSIIKCLSDNYSYLLRDKKTNLVGVVDPSEFDTVDKKIQNTYKKLDFILNTHHHNDHIDGNKDLKKKYNSKIVCSSYDEQKISGSDIRKKDGEKFLLGETAFQILHVPGHTLGHIAFYSSNAGVIFTGDTLFSLGCGRIFEGTFEQMFNSLERIKKLPKDTEIYCGHEYTLQNSNFCIANDSQNFKLKDKIIEIKKKLANNLPTIPSILSEELECNIFLKAKDLESFSKLRDLKDNF